MVVINHPISVVPAVVFEDQSLAAIKQVWTSQETTFLVTEPYLRFRPWEPGVHQENA